jgi:Mg-chelatase subunit ChlD
MGSELSNIGNGTPAWLQTLQRTTGKTVETQLRSCPEGVTFVGIVDLVLDCSGSMSDNGKLAFAQSGGANFANDAWKKGYSVGLIRFADTAERLMVPEPRGTHLRNLLEELFASGFTNLAAAIRLSTQHLADRSGQRCMCIVTDGMPTDAADALSAAQVAKSRGISIMVIGTEDADWSFLRQLATRRNLAVHVPTQQLHSGIRSMAKLLPGPS